MLEEFWESFLFLFLSGMDTSWKIILDSSRSERTSAPGGILGNVQQADRLPGSLEEEKKKKNRTMYRGEKFCPMIG